jgi:transcriptional regulator with XRE-family HTH domain
MNIQERLKMVMKMHNLTSSAFADKIGVQRSSVSHILTGRNNPSLDFIEKTLINFPRVNADWLILGKVTQQSGNESVIAVKSEEQVRDTEDQATYRKDASITEKTNVRSIERIVIFYSNGTFEEMRPS